MNVKFKLFVICTLFFLNILGFGFYKYSQELVYVTFGYENTSLGHLAKEHKIPSAYFPYTNEKLKDKKVFYSKLERFKIWNLKRDPKISNVEVIKDFNELEDDKLIEKKDLDMLIVQIKELD